MSTTTQCSEATVSYFTFLPTLMEEQAHTDPGVLDDAPGGHLSPGGPRRVLVVDDSLLMRSAASLGLGRVDGWQVATASCGRDGLELAASYRPDAILLDVVMADLDGPATLRALREQAATHDVPVVFLTADAGTLGDLVAMGAAGVIAKPFKPEDLAAQLSELLGWT
jgi:CheY-like chemotaxis protein